MTTLATALHVALLVFFLALCLAGSIAMVAASRGRLPVRPASLLGAACFTAAWVIDLTVIREPLGTVSMACCVAYNAVIAARPSLYRRGS